ncbi:MAG: hypothetical protein WB771_06615 [Solirubrobacterales bacterium]
MSRESARFFAVAIPVALVGTLIATWLGWGETAVFFAGMAPVAIVMAIFMLREPRDSAGDARISPRQRA